MEMKTKIVGELVREVSWSSAEGNVPEQLVPMTSPHSRVGDLFSRLPYSENPRL